MARAEQVDDSFLDDVDDSFLDDVPSTSAKAEDDPNDRVWGISRSLAKKLVADNEAKQQEQLKSIKGLVTGAVRVPTLGFRQDLGQLGAAIVDKAYGSELPFGELVKRAKPQVEQYYEEAEKDAPISHAAGTAIGAIPTALALAPATKLLASATKGTAISPFVAKLLGAGAAGVDAGALQGLISYNEDDPSRPSSARASDAWDQAVLGGVMGAAGSLAPEAAVSAYHLGKQGLGKLAQLPSKASNALAEFLGNAPKPAEAEALAAAVPDNVVPIRPDQADVPTKVSPLRRLLNDERGAVEFGGKPPAQDPEFLRKSKELADMLGQSDTKIGPMPDPGIRGPNIKHKGAYRGQQFRFPEDRAGWERDPAAWKMGEDSSEPGSIMDLLMADKESPQTQAAIEALNRNERGMSRMRNPADFDSSIARAPKPAEAAEAAAFEGPATGKGGGDLYNPMGLKPKAIEPDTQMTSKPDWFDQLERMGVRRPDAPMTDDLFEQISNDVNAAGAAKLRDVPWERSALKERAPIEVSPLNEPGAAQQAISPADDAAIQAARARGREKMKEIGGYLGGAAGTLKYGPLGAWPGYKSGQKAVSAANAIADKAGAIGAGMEQSAAKALSPEAMAKNMIANPAILSRIAQSDSPLAGAAKFILDGANEAGEIGMQARAFVAAAMPSMRELFTGGD